MKPHVLALIALAGCHAGFDEHLAPTGVDGGTGATPDPVPETGSAAPACGSGIQADHSLFVTNPAVLAKFGFTRTLDQIVATSPLTTPLTGQKLWDTWMENGFGAPDCSAPGVDPNHFGYQCPRTEQILSGIDIYQAATSVHFDPIAIVNRIDLAPTNGDNCGEFRIVYQLRAGFFTGHIYLSFDGFLPNPHRDQGVAACQPVAQWWKDRSTDSDADLAANLEAFFYQGAVPQFQPVVRMNAYGFGAAGAIRWNGSLSSATPPFMRQFQTNVTGTTLSIRHAEETQAPAVQWFDGTAPEAQTFWGNFTNEMATLVGSDVAT
ncbi:MAG TPA: hypothetical protein VGC41_28810, partial [Kofleriaceae bacterium]